MRLSVVHFSDIHITDNGDKILKRIDSLKAAVTSSLPSNGSVLIAVSGDIAFSGKKEQYEIANSLLGEIAEYIQKEKGSQVNIVSVPGNHDCNFDENTTVRDTLIKSVLPQSLDSDFYNTVNTVQNEYRNFASKFSINTSEIYSKVEIQFGEQKALFVLCNTAWMSELKEFPGKIIMPSAEHTEINPENYSVVFGICHHPENWLNPDYKQDFITFIRKNIDIMLFGHEHARDGYEKAGKGFSVVCNHGKELQDTESDDSAFSVINFEDSFQNYEIADYTWNGNMYDMVGCNEKQFHKNISIYEKIFQAQKEILDYVNDIGLLINHFAKEEVTLTDLFVWPDFNKMDYRKDNKVVQTIRDGIQKEFLDNTLNIIIGSSSIGKTSVAKRIFSLEEDNTNCCLLMRGNNFNSADENSIKTAIKEAFIKQYTPEKYEDFKQLPKSKRSIIIDDFDNIKGVKDRRSSVLDYLCDYFGRVTIILGSTYELTTLLKSEYIGRQDELNYYEILPFGNRKRKQLISKWYYLSENNATEDEILLRIENAKKQIDTFLGNGAGFIPALPVFIIGVLQNGDAMQQTFSGSKYGFLYETLIISNISKVSDDYSKAGQYRIDQGILSELAFDLLLNKKTCFSKHDLKKAVTTIGEEHILELNENEFLNKMIRAKIIYEATNEGEEYKFKYPYILYYFAGRYIAYNLQDEQVKSVLEYMSNKLYNEVFANIVIFVCHFSGNREVIDNILLNAYSTFEEYDAFDFTRTNPIFDRIKEAVEKLLPKSAEDNSAVEVNKEKALMNMDEMGINDGRVHSQDEIEDEEVTEKEMASVISALKTIEVLGQILQNYPTDVKRREKLEIIDEIHNLGMRTVQAMINTMGYLEEELINYVAEHEMTKRKNIRHEDVVSGTRQFINMLIYGMASGMIHQVASALNSEHLLPAAREKFENNTSISSKLILADLKMNCLNEFNYSEIKDLKKSFENAKETFAVKTLELIIAHYLNYNKCSPQIRAKLSTLCDCSEKQVFLEQQKNTLN